MKLLWNVPGYKSRMVNATIIHDDATSNRIEATRGHYIGVRRCWPLHSRETRERPVFSRMVGRTGCGSALAAAPPKHRFVALLYCNNTLRKRMEHVSALSCSPGKGSPGTCPLGEELPRLTSFSWPESLFNLRDKHRVHKWDVWPWPWQQ